MLLLILPVLALALLFFLTKCFFLAPFRIGWSMYLANVIYETLIIKLHWKRVWIDAGLFALVLIGAGIVWGTPGVGILSLLMSGAWVYALTTENQWLLDIPAVQHRDFKHRVPLPIPRLVINIRGPVLERTRKGYQLGDWPVGHSAEFTIYVLNPTTVRAQLPLLVSVNTDANHVEIHRTGDEISNVNDDGAVRGWTYEDTCPEPGQLHSCAIQLKALKPGPGSRIRIRVVHGDLVLEKQLHLRSVFPTEKESIQSAQINRWPYGAKGAFNWRGDHDLYDPCTFQSEDGLRKALGLAARYRMPTSIMMSAKLSLVEEEHREFCEHHGWNRRSGEIPSFIRFMKEEVDMRSDQEFPTDNDKPYSAEIGNHFYLHYATHAAADPGNKWTSHARMGEGFYSWMTGAAGDSFSEQRDNAVKGSDVLESTLGQRPSSFTIPGDALDGHTARAIEAAGIEVGTETDAGKLQKLLFFPKEHHPEGCDRLVELTRVLPRDPQTAPQIAMLKFWVAFARRNRRAMVYLAHHHMVMYEGMACLNLTSELLRFILSDMEGDIHSATLTSLGRYWRDVLSEKQRSINLDVEAGCLRVHNTSKRAWTGIPVEVSTKSGNTWMMLLDIGLDGALIKLNPAEAL